MQTENINNYTDLKVEIARQQEQLNIEINAGSAVNLSLMKNQ